MQSILSTPEAYGIDELADRGPLGRSILFKAIREGRLTARKCGRRTLILHQVWRAFLENLPTAQPMPKAS